MKPWAIKYNETMKKTTMSKSRRHFIQQVSIAGTGVLLTNPIQLFSQINENNNTPIMTF